MIAYSVRRWHDGRGKNNSKRGKIHAVRDGAIACNYTRGARLIKRAGSFETVPRRQRCRYCEQELRLL